MAARKTSRHQLRPRVDLLEGRQLLTVVVETEPNNTAKTADVAAFPADGQLQLQGTSTSSADKDFFTFNAPKSGPLSIALNRTSGGRVEVSIETKTGVKVFETESNNGVVSGQANLVSGTNYVVRVRSKTRAAATYRVDMNLGSGSTTGGGNTGGGVSTGTIAESEPNNDARSAKKFGLDAAGKAKLTGVSTSKDDSDFFVFTATKSGTLSVNVASTTGTQPASLEVETPGSINVFETEPKNGVNSGSFQVVAGTTYTFRFRSKSTLAASYSADLSLS